MSYYYIDTKTGKRVSANKWKHSKSHGGTRYKRRILKQKAKNLSPILPSKPIEIELKVTRMKYESGDKYKDFEIVQENSKLIEVRIDGKIYTQQRDLEKFVPLILESTRTQRNSMADTYKGQASNRLGQQKGPIHKGSTKAFAKSQAKATRNLLQGKRRR